ncbi:MAG: hypothetical protein JXR16_00765 [Bermanella sp.]
MYKKLGASAVIVGLFSSVNIAQAADDDLGIYGFLSVGAAVLDTENRVDSNNINYGNSVSLDGFDEDSGNFKQDAIFGLQITKQVNDKTSATGQLVSRGGSNYNTEAAWAFVTYNATKDIDIRMGRLRIPFFYYSEFLEVGYAYNWVRTPSDVYSLPFSSFDGADITKRFSFGRFDGSVKLNYGRFTETIDLYGDNYEADLTNIVGIVAELNRGDFGFRLSAQQAEVTFDMDKGDGQFDAAAGRFVSDSGRLVDDLRANAIGAIANSAFNDAQKEELKEEFTFDAHKANFYDAAFTYNNGTYGLVAEANSIIYESALLMDIDAWLVSVSRRISDVTLHATYSTSKSDFDSGNAGLIQKQLPLHGEDVSMILGARYDYSSGTALKFEVEHHDEKIHLNQDGNSGMLYSVAVDMIF